MATTTIQTNIDNAILADAIAALCWSVNYQATIPDPANKGQFITNPITPAIAAKAALAGIVANVYVQYKQSQATAAVVPPTGLIS